MRIATRLVLTLGLTTTAVMVIYGFIALDQREALLREGLARETETLARSAQIVTNNALRDGRFEDLDRVLGRIADDPQTLVAAVLGGEERVLAGGPDGALTCLQAAPAVRRMNSMEMGEEGLRGWIDCKGVVRWVVLPVREPGARLILGRRGTVLERDSATSRARILWTTLVLAAAAAAAILLVLRQTLSAPLSQIMRGVRSLGGPYAPDKVEVPRVAGELRDLAVAFNEMSERLEGKRKALIQEAEERVALERRLRSAEKFAALGRLTGGLAHELGTPLNVIAVRAEAIDGAPDVPPHARRHAGEIVQEVDRIATLVRSLRHVSRGHPLERRRVNLADVLGGVAESMRERAETVGAVMHVDVGEPIAVLGDETLLRHAVMNLAVNAVQALADHPGPREMWLRLERADGWGVIVVEDTGPGVPPVARPRLFEPFFTTRDVGEGMGLGLAISQGIAEEHGGELRIDDRGEGGIRATLTIPAHDAVESA